jgi:hypothetical protein
MVRSKQAGCTYLMSAAGCSLRLLLSTRHPDIVFHDHLCLSILQKQQQAVILVSSKIAKPIPDEPQLYTCFGAYYWVCL